LAARGLSEMSAYLVKYFVLPLTVWQTPRLRKGGRWAHRGVSRLRAGGGGTLIPDESANPTPVGRRERTRSTKPLM
jgi:hypothetical protein